MTTETKVEAVAWPERMVNLPCPYGSSDRIVGFRVPDGHPALGKYGLSEPIQWLERVTVGAASAITALEGEVERARIAGIDACDKLTMLWQKDIDRADAAERRVAEIHGALRIALASIDETCKEMTIGDRFTNAGQSLIDALPVCRAALTKESP